MRIAYILNTLQVGGAERQVLALAERMRARGHVVKLIVLREAAPRDLCTDLDVVHLDAAGDPLSALRSYMRAVRAARGFRPGIVHSNQFHGNMLGRALRLAMPSTTLVCTIHNVREGGRARMLAYRLTDALADRTVAVCEAACERFAEVGAIRGSKSNVIANGIDVAAFSPDCLRRNETRRGMQMGEAFLWLAVGRIAPAKDYATLLRAFAQVNAARPEARLWIAGEGKTDHVLALQRATAEAGMVHAVRWLGLRDDIAALLDAADAFVLSSAWEGMPLALGEAMAMEKPFAATDVGGVREMAGECGALARAGDAKALSAAMLELMQRRPEDRHSAGQAARERILAHFSMEANADAWEAFYADAISKRAQNEKAGA